MRAFLAGFRLEVRMVRANPDNLIPLFTAPLFTIIFLTIVRNHGRHDLQPDALMAPVLMTMWWFALFQGGNMLTNDRWQAMLEECHRYAVWRKSACQRSVADPHFDGSVISCGGASAARLAAVNSGGNR